MMVQPSARCFARTLLASLGLLGLVAAAWADPPRNPPRQEIWYHTGYPGGVVGPQSGMSARMGPTKMPVIFEEILRRQLVPSAQIHNALHVLGAWSILPGRKEPPHESVA